MQIMRLALMMSAMTFVVVSVVFVVAFAVFFVVGIFTSSYVDNGGFGELRVRATAPPEVAASSFPIAG